MKTLTAPKFWKNFLRFATVGLSLFVLFAATSQFSIVNNFSKQGPAVVSAQDEGGSCMGTIRGRNTTTNECRDFQDQCMPAGWVTDSSCTPNSGSTTNPTPTPTNQPSTGSACEVYQTNRICGNQVAYQRCSVVKYDGNRAYYDCEAPEAPSRCNGRIYCSDRDRSAAGNPAPQNAAPTCDGVATITLYGTTTYDTCEDNLGGTNRGGNLCTRGATKFKCHASQNNNCTSGGLIYGCPVSSTNNQVTVRVGQGGQSQDVSSQSEAVADCDPGEVRQQNSQGNWVCVAQSQSQSQGSQQTQTGGDQTGGDQTQIQGDQRQTTTTGDINITLDTGDIIKAINGDCPRGSVKKTVNNETVCEVTQPRVVVAGAATSNVKELPKTGLPLLAFAGAAFLPLGFGMKRFNKGTKTTETAQFMWEERKYKRS